MAYPTLAECRSHIGVEAFDASEDGRLESARLTAIADVEAFCGRKFTQDSAVSARVYRTADACYFRLPAGHDISTTTGLIVKTDDSGSGTFGTTWTIDTDFVLEPFDGVGYDGATGWPYNRICAVGSRYFWRSSYNRPNLQVTAKWGWAAVPTAVFEAVLLHAATLWKMKDAPFGMTGGDLLGNGLRAQQNPAVAALLARYQHGSAGAVIA